MCLKSTSSSLKSRKNIKANLQSYLIILKYKKIKDIIKEGFSNLQNKEKLPQAYKYVS